nr:MAG TPA: hypothetical protein [Caudoviricetes sp.]
MLFIRIIVLHNLSYMQRAHPSSYKKTNYSISN